MFVLSYLFLISSRRLGCLIVNVNLSFIKVHSGNRVRLPFPNIIRPYKVVH